MLDIVDCATTVADDAFTKPRTQRPAVVLDLAHLRTYTMGMADLEREILGLFLDQLPKSQAALNAAASARDWHMAAHTLKGSALAVGAKRLAALGVNAEATDDNDPQARRDILNQIDIAVSEVRSEIERQGLL